MPSCCVVLNLSIHHGFQRIMLFDMYKVHWFFFTVLLSSALFFICSIIFFFVWLTCIVLVYSKAAISVPFSRNPSSSWYLLTCLPSWVGHCLLIPVLNIGKYQLQILAPNKQWEPLAPDNDSHYKHWFIWVQILAPDINIRN